jgi:hypothetical protein
VGTRQACRNALFGQGDSRHAPCSAGRCGSRFAPSGRRRPRAWVARMVPTNVGRPGVVGGIVVVWVCVPDRAVSFPRQVWAFARPTHPGHRAAAEPGGRARTRLRWGATCARCSRS